MTGGDRRIWIDLANAPHVLVCAPIVERLRGEGWDVLLSARDHAKTLELASARWPDVEAIGGPSPAGAGAKAAAIARRAGELVRFARAARPTVAFSHGSYAQIVAARMCGVPAVTMMDYEHQPANHLSFRLARAVIVPAVFPGASLRRFGVHGEKVRRYSGFKEELYLAGFRPDPAVIRDLGVSEDGVIVVLRTPPDGALYHRGLEGRFEELLQAAARMDGVTAILLTRTDEQARRYEGIAGVVTPRLPIDSLSLLAFADLVVGGGGTMTREAALLGTPTYTVFAGELGAVDAELIRRGLLHDLRTSSEPRFVKKAGGTAAGGVPVERAESILRLILRTVADVAA